jgi:hypothetical protein
MGMRLQVALVVLLVLLHRAEGGRLSTISAIARLTRT